MVLQNLYKKEQFLRQVVARNTNDSRKLSKNLGGLVASEVIKDYKCSKC